MSLASSLWKQPVTLADLNAGRGGTLIEHLGIRFTDIGDDHLSASMPVDARTRQPHGLLHGGASVVLAETLGSTAAMLAVDREKYACVGQEINANHLRPVRNGHVTGVARPIHVGGRSQVWGIEILNEARELICVSRLTVAVIGIARLAASPTSGVSSAS